MPTDIMRLVSWVNSALKEFQGFPEPVQEFITAALTSVSLGEMPEAAKPLKGFKEGVFEVSSAYRSDAWRTVYALKIDDDI